MLWLTFFVFLITPVTSVCNVCFGDAQGCSGASDHCPWKIGMAENVAAIAGAVASVIKLDKLLPPRYLRVFTRPVLQTLGIISSKPKGGASFDMTGKSGKDIYEATVGGHVPKDEAVIELIRNRIADEDCANGLLLDGFPQARGLETWMLGGKLRCMLEGRRLQDE